MWAHIAKNAFPRLRGLLPTYVYIMCSRAHAFIIRKQWIWFLKIYDSDLRDELQKVCWEQRIWDVFRKAHPLLPGVSVSNISKSKTDQFLVREFLRHSVGRFCLWEEQGTKFISFPKRPDHSWGPPSFSVKWVPGALFPSLKKLVHVVDRSHPFSAKMSGTVTECRYLFAVVLK